MKHNLSRVLTSFCLISSYVPKVERYNNLHGFSLTRVSFEILKEKADLLADIFKKARVSIVIRHRWLEGKDFKAQHCQELGEKLRNLLTFNLTWEKLPNGGNSPIRVLVELLIDFCLTLAEKNQGFRVEKCYTFQKVA